MALMAGFRYYRPTALDEAVGIAGKLASDSEEFNFCSGGTDLVPLLKNRLIAPSSIISLTAIKELGGVALRNERTVSIGSQTTLDELIGNNIVRKLLPSVSEAASLVATRQIRNRATAGGNLLVNNRCIFFNQSETNRKAHGECFKSGGEACHLIPNAVRGKAPLCRARFVSDLAPVLMLMDARLSVAGPSGYIHVPLAEFYIKDGIERNRLEKGEILTHVEVRVPRYERIAYEKLRIRNAIDFPSLGVAVSLSDVHGIWSMGVAVSGADTHPVLLNFSTNESVGFDEMLLNACHEVTKAVTPLKQEFFPPSYKKKMIAVFINRCVKRLLEKQ
ncbi:MAG: FAD binding domain-containing protein [Bdellovibrionota bacterium]